MDNLRVHKTGWLMPYYERLNMIPVWNVTYSPEFNPIETFFAQVKLFYKRERLNLVANKKHCDEKALIRKAFKHVKA